MSEISLFSNDASPFDQIKHINADGSEYWLGREVMPLLGYQQWRRFEESVERAKFACQNSLFRIDDHFADAGKVVKRSQGGGSRQSDFKLGRYGCYLTAMNGDSRKPEIAAAQTYFAIKTREAELAPQFEKLISELLPKFEQQNRIIEKQGRTIALLQSQIQTLLPLSSNAAPPGWNQDVWDKLPPQDKRHFRYIFRRRNFRPSHQGKNEPLSLPTVTIEQVKQKQLAEVEQLLGEVSPEEKEKLETAKQEALRKFWLQEEDVAF